MSASLRDLVIADVTMTLADAARGNFVTGDDESLAAIAVELVDQIDSRYQGSFRPGLMSDPYEARRLVGRWLRVRAEFLRPGIGFLSTTGQLESFRRQLLQLAADAEHSDLLVRLFGGQEPLDYEEWERREKR